MLGKERCCEVPQVSQQRILLIRPIRGKFKRIAVRLVLALHFGSLFLPCIAGSVRIVLRLSTVRYNEYLHKVKHRLACPEGVSLIAVYLIKGLLDVHPAFLQLNMYHRYSVDEYRHVVAVLIGTLRFILMNHL